MTILFLALLQAFDDGKHQRPIIEKPDLRLEIEVVKTVRQRKLTLRCVVINRGNAGVYFAPSFLAGGLIHLTFTDAVTKKKVRYKGDDLAGYVPLNPEQNFRLQPRMLVGTEIDFDLESMPDHFSAQAICSLKDIGKLDTARSGRES